MPHIIKPAVLSIRCSLRLFKMPVRSCTSFCINHLHFYAQICICYGRVSSYHRWHFLMSQDKLSQHYDLEALRTAIQTLMATWKLMSAVFLCKVKLLAISSLPWNQWWDHCARIFLAFVGAPQWHKYQQWVMFQWDWKKHGEVASIPTSQSWGT